MKWSPNRGLGKPTGEEGSEVVSCALVAMDFSQTIARARDSKLNKFKKVA